MSAPVIRAARRAAAACALLALAAGPALAADAAFDRTKPPALGEAKPLQVPPLQIQRLPNGLVLAVAEMHKVPVVDVTLLVRAGSVRDPQDMPGLATFTAGMLDEGAGKRSALEIAEEADFLGASLSTGAGFEMASVRLHCTKAKLPQALDLMADVALRPAFADSEIARQRELRKNAILQLRDQPTAIAPIAFNAIVLGPDYPYGRPAGGTDSSTAALDRAKVVDFYQRYYRPSNTRVLVVGDVTPVEARQLVEARFGEWTGEPVEMLPMLQPPAPGPRTVYIVDKPGAAQSVIRIGNPAVARSSPDYYVLRVLNTILGGSFTSRLNQNLRETHGYTYGARSSFDMYRLVGPFQAGASVQTAKTDSSLIEFFKELRRIRDEEVPAEELDKAKAYITLGLPSEFETTQGAAGMYTDLLGNDLPLNTYDTLVENIKKVTAADVKQAARRYIDEGHFSVVVVGDRSQIEAPVKALNEGPVEIRDLWGKPAQ